MENSLSLHQKVVLISGSLSKTVASIIMNLTRMGADCVLLDTEKSVASAFVNQINDEREINEKFGRVFIIQGDFKSAAEVKDAVGKAAQTYGGLDFYIDALTIQHPTPLKFDGEIENLDLLIEKHLKLPLMITQSVMAYLRNRKRGRVIYLLNVSPVAKIKEDLGASAVRSGLLHFTQALAKQASEFNVTVNSLSLTLTEEYILQHDPESKSIKEAMDKMKVLDPSVKITEADKIAQTVVILLSPMGATLSGQNMVVS